ncbi:4-aminobutyrate aminotransferase [Micromonospora pallida]|uniref:4-aminobutyrate aminotransferase n=1 Tax=Micromonospora pallida TaxID=145854 RepID=A0A1C6T657_9ACTN|nr:aminotransferase class III-fold pyridoxal phosphate-dependent enzyme [Micromonospora pallida]SCL37003.1 4-aminobutyrate aminotransferase [Micromonospora pallida]
MSAVRNKSRPTESGVLDGQMINKFDLAQADALPPRQQALLARRRATLGDIYPLFYEEPLYLVRGSGTRLYTADGTEYLDVYNNVQATGHGNPRIAEAVRQQLLTLATHTRYLQDGVVDYAERFLATHPDHLDHVIFSNSGSEANDLAIRIAQWRTGNLGVVVTESAYHGNSALTAGCSPENGSSMPLAPWVRTVAAPDTFRYGADAGAVFAESIRRAVWDLRRHGMGTAALLLDSIMSTDGIYPGEPGMLVEGYQAIREAGGLVVADEVQPGLGRTGDHWWGFLRHTDQVDMVTCGKPMAGGMPMGSLVLPAELSDAYAASHRYFNTFGGNPVTIAAAAAVMDEIESRDLMGNARDLGAWLTKELSGISSPLVGDVRGAGLFIGVEMVAHQGHPAGDVARYVVNGLRAAHVLISAVGRSGQVLKIRPPLVFDEEDAKQFVESYRTVLRDVESTVHKLEGDR